MNGHATETRTERPHRYAGTRCREGCGREANGRMADGAAIPICQECKDAQDAALAGRVRHERVVADRLTRVFLGLGGGQA